MESSIFAQWTAISILKKNSLKLFLGKRNFHELCENTLKLIRQKKCINDSLLVLLFSSTPFIINLDDADMHEEAVTFLASLILSADLTEAERGIIIQLAKEHIPSMAVFWNGRLELIDRMTGSLECKEIKEKHSMKILQSLVCA